MAAYRRKWAKNPVLGQKNKANPCSDWSYLEKEEDIDIKIRSVSN